MKSNSVWPAQSVKGAHTWSGFACQMSGQDGTNNVRYIIVMHSVRFKARRQNEQDKLVQMKWVWYTTLICHWDHITKSRCSKNPPEWLKHMMHWPCLSWVSFWDYRKDTSTICLRQRCDHQVDKCTTSRYCVHEAQHAVQYIFIYLLQFASAKRNSSVGNDKYKRLEIYTDSTLDTEASLKLPWSLAKQSWQSSLAVKIKLPRPCVWWCLLMYEIWETILQYEGAGSCCVRATSVDVMIIIIISFLHNTAQLYLTVHGCKDCCFSQCKTGTKAV